MTYWEGAARMIARLSKTSKIVVEKSTVPVNTAEAIEKVALKHIKRSIASFLNTYLLDLTLPIPSCRPNFLKKDVTEIYFRASHSTLTSGFLKGRAPEKGNFLDRVRYHHISALWQLTQWLLDRS